MNINMAMNVTADGVMPTSVLPEQLLTHPIFGRDSVFTEEQGYRIKKDLSALGDRLDRLRQQWASNWVPGNAVVRHPTSTATGEHVSPPVSQDMSQAELMSLSIMVALIVMETRIHNSNQVCVQLEHATEVQAFLRNKQVADYQEQLSKAIAAEDQRRVAQTVNAVFDWIISDIEVVVGAIKIGEGLVSGNLLEAGDGLAYCLAGLSGMIKAGAETTELFAGRSEVGQKLISSMGTAQSLCEGVAFTLDLFQFCRGVYAAKALTQGTEQVLKAGMGVELLEAATSGAKTEVSALAEQIGKTVSEDLCSHFGQSLEREMVSVGEMAFEAEERTRKATSSMTRCMGRSFTDKNVAVLVQGAVEKAAGTLGKNATETMLHKQIRSQLRRSIARAVLSDVVSKAMVVTRGLGAGVVKGSAGWVEYTTADMRKRVEQLIVQQNFADFMHDWMETRKKAQQKTLNALNQDCADTLKGAVAAIDECSAALANAFGARA